MDEKRAAGSFCNACRQIVSSVASTAGLRWRGGIGGAWTVLKSNTVGGPEKESTPVSSSYRMTPRAYTSAAGPTVDESPRACSGAM
jgi:hypothetical protein